MALPIAEVQTPTRLAISASEIPYSRLKIQPTLPRTRETACLWLNSYAYCGHSALMGRRDRPWQNVDYVLHSFGKRVGRARREYLLYVEAGVEQGRRRDLVGGGLVRSLGGWAEAEILRLRGLEHIKSDDLAKSRKAMAA